MLVLLGQLLDLLEKLFFVSIKLVALTIDLSDCSVDDALVLTGKFFWGLFRCLVTH